MVYCCYLCLFLPHPLPVTHKSDQNTFPFIFRTILSICRLFGVWASSPDKLVKRLFLSKVNYWTPSGENSFLQLLSFGIVLKSYNLIYYIFILVPPGSTQYKIINVLKQNTSETWKQDSLEKINKATIIHILSTLRFFKVLFPCVYKNEDQSCSKDSVWKSEDRNKIV